MKKNKIDVINGFGKLKRGKPLSLIFPLLDLMNSLLSITKFSFKTRSIYIPHAE
jgi:hypothetical protein